MACAASCLTANPWISRKESEGPSVRPEIGDADCIWRVLTPATCDAIHIRMAEAALLEHDAPAYLLVALLREMVGQECWPRMAGVVADRLVPLMRGARQGALGTPRLWNVVMRVMVYRCLAAWEGETPVEWCDALGALQIMVFVDTLFLLANCPGKFQRRWAEVWEVPKGWDVHFGTDSLEILHNTGGSVEIRLPDGRHLAENNIVSVLGVTIGDQGSTLAAITGREVAAQKTWFKWRGALLSRVVFAQDRVHKLYTTVGAAFGSGGRTFSTAVWRRECRQENRWLRATLFGRKI